MDESQFLNVMESFVKYQTRIEEALGYKIRLEVRGSDHYFIVSEDGLTSYGGFSMSMLEGCCGVVVSHRAWVTTSQRGKGVGALLNQIRCDIAKDQGYGKIMCTTIMDNERQIKILNKNGWELSDTFVNPKTGNTIGTYYKELL